MVYKDIGNEYDLSKYRLELAHSTLKSAVLAFDEQELKMAMNRAYYAAFYAIRAIFALDKKDFKKHKTVIGEFNKNYIATGIFDKNFGKNLSKLKTIREKSDYEDFYIISKEEAKEQIDIVKDFINIIEQYLSARYKKSGI